MPFHTRLFEPLRITCLGELLQVGSLEHQHVCRLHQHSLPMEARAHLPDNLALPQPTCSKPVPIIQRLAPIARPSKKTSESFECGGIGFRNKILFAPSKAANAGGVAVSGLEMSQNSARISWSEDELQKLLRDTMTGIHDQCVQYGQESDDYVNYLKGANVAGFVKVADAMLAYGVI